MKYLEKDSDLKLRHIHPITGCDTTSFAFCWESKKPQKMHETSPESQSFKCILEDFNSSLQIVSKFIKIYTNFLLRWPGN